MLNNRHQSIFDIRFQAAHLTVLGRRSAPESIKLPSNLNFLYVPWSLKVPDGQAAFRAAKHFNQVIVNARTRGHIGGQISP
jgi:hypothetical protein